MEQSKTVKQNCRNSSLAKISPYRTTRERISLIKKFKSECKREEDYTLSDYGWFLTFVGANLYDMMSETRAFLDRYYTVSKAAHRHIQKYGKMTFYRRHR